MFSAGFAAVFQRKFCGKKQLATMLFAINPLFRLDSVFLAATLRWLPLGRCGESV